MLSRPRSLLFWLVLIILLYVIATAPTEVAHAVLALRSSTNQFFDSLDIFIDTLETS
ncbi:MULTISPECIES: hypothetical protein [unclassified Streptomyces]|uniref:hypothetical protein n=1 Tax=unclassified Streptomyces TaxID=2593676 RepID=UPI002E1322B2|nr:hypothetical protein OG452_24600 [Streptomyces sp. NBC_01197]WSS49063.1 hypothetical protein OG708_10630 [Streptomyces sp. NBC_01180]